MQTNSGETHERSTNLRKQLHSDLPHHAGYADVRLKNTAPLYQQETSPNSQVTALYSQRMKVKGKSKLLDSKVRYSNPVQLFSQFFNTIVEQSFRYTLAFDPFNSVL